MQWIVLIFFVAMIIFAVRVVILSVKKKKAAINNVQVDEELLNSHVKFYQRLNENDKNRFRNEVAAFLKAVIITPVNTTITDADRTMIGASAVIPMFAFEGWTYPNLNEVLVYNDHFNMQFQTEGNESRNIMGLVGTGAYKDKMMISKSALQLGFDNSTDKSNTAIHEFVHLIDGADGATDGLPEILMDKSYIVPWMELMHREMEKMKDEDSDINPYGYTNKTEFFAVIAEYFFERPDLFEEKHPEMFEMMQRIFKTGKEEKSIKG